MLQSSGLRGGINVFFTKECTQITSPAIFVLGSLIMSGLLIKVPFGPLGNQGGVSFQNSVLVFWHSCQRRTLLGHTTQPAAAATNHNSRHVFMAAITAKYRGSETQGRSLASAR
jgi:hypothetical protein